MKQFFIKIGKRGLPLLYFFISLQVCGQKFYLLDSLEIKPLYSISGNGVWEQINSDKLIAYFWHDFSPHKANIFTFFVYDLTEKHFYWDSLDMRSFLPPMWSISSAAINSKYLALLGDKIYLFKRNNNKYKFIKKIKVKGDYNSVFLMGENKLILVSNYDFLKNRKKSLYSPVQIKCYDISNRRFLHKKIAVDIGKSISLCSYFPFYNVAVSDHYIFVSELTNLSFYVYPDNCSLFKKVSLSEFSFHTDSILNLYLTDSILSMYYTYPKNKIEIIDKNELYKYPLAHKIGVINNDTVIIVANISKKDFDTKRKLFFYSIKQDSIVDTLSVCRKDNNVPRTIVTFTSNPIPPFINGREIVELSNKFDEKQNKFIYMLKFYRLSYANKWVKLLPQLYNIKGTIIDRNRILKENTFILYADEYMCMSCFKKYYHSHILIILEDVKSANKGWRFQQIKFYKSFFPNSTVLFFKKGSKIDIPKNKVFSL